MKAKFTYTLMLCVGATAFACGDDSSGDDDPVVEAGVTDTDTSDPTDTDEPTDTEPTDTDDPTDTDEPTDTGEPTDTDDPTDTDEPEDAGEPTDTDDPTDAGTETDEPTDTDVSDGGTDDGGPPSNFILTSPGFEDGDALPSEHTCEDQEFGAGYSPELSWSGAPEETQVYALVFKDVTLEADAPRLAFHWAAWNIPSTVTGIGERLSAGDFPPELSGGEQFRAGPEHANEFFGPCPSWQTLCAGADRVTDSYAFVLYAFDVEELLPPEPVEGDNYVEALSAYFEANAIAQTELNATSDAVPSSAPMCADPTDGGVLDAGPGALDASTSDEAGVSADAGADAGDAGN